MELAVGEAGSDGRRVFTGFIRDLTERQQTENRMQELQCELLHVSRLSAMGQMASALAHELNQPLTAITNYVQAMRRMRQATKAAGGGAHPRDDGQGRRAGYPRRSNHPGLARFHRKGPDRATARRHQQGGRGSHALGAGRCQGGREKYTDPFQPCAAAAVLIDKVQIQQVVFNLIRNSVEALPESDLRELTVGTARRPTAWRWSPSATAAPVLAPIVAEQLFQPFVTTKEKGLGLGLSICRSIVDAHGGRLWATPNPASGVTFQFSVPMARRRNP